ncbi:nucleoside triphosphate hydrolase protein [Wolfiporia cocos MD-104 SS10]|uniref:Nucleoside triphosphate hydrolase protein n=1 Tax=Wolfiporia cocos (strain MD-104) TaxID=742152 RepID=A0A2H3JMK5_WOLCO|nr:nucleoside triphosphate hydrolase protein [Wolfiporia cocos MD-104 SS10]
MSGQPCRFYNKPGGCMRGARCTYRHVAPGSALPNTASGSSHVPGGSSKSSDDGSTKSKQASAGAKAPPGVCNIFWTTGDCSRGFNCRYRHVPSPSHLDSGSASTPTVARDALVPFLTPEGLARLTNRGTDGFFSIDTTKPLSPSEVQSYLSRFLFDSYRFRHAVDVYTFVSLLSNASANNAKWSPEDGQLLLKTLSTGNGLLRLNDVLAWGEVSLSAGGRRDVLSFQRGYLLLLRYLASDWVVTSVASHSVNALYTLVLENFDHLAEVVESCMNQAVLVSKSFKDPSLPSGKEIMGSQVIVALTKILFECITRFKNALATHPTLHSLVLNVRKWTTAWIEGISCIPPTFDDTLATSVAKTREHIVQHLDTQVNQIVAIVDRKHNELERAQRKEREPLLSLPVGSNEGVLAALENAYEGPGELRQDGPRHDNDFITISDIRIAPTHAELTCKIPPFLPANLYGAPHPCPPESMARLLDTQFRLLREELTASLRLSVQLVLDDLASGGRDTRLADVLKKRGGKYRGHVAGQDAVLFNLYTNVDFAPITPESRGLAVGLTLDTPPGRARSTQTGARKAFWESMASKRLMQGGLIALIWQKPGSETTVHLGTIASSTRDLVASSSGNPERVALRVTFFDSEVELRILQELKHSERDRQGTRVLVEATVLFESVRPFLEALRVEPETVPFSRYLAHHPPGFLSTSNILPPEYARAPGFKFQLSSLFPPEAEVGDLTVDVTDATSVATARTMLREHSRLDPSQADAVIEALMRELVLIQGPPGTGKSFTGVELLRVLLANGVRPIVMIAFTNHALDHMLSSVLDAGITKKLVRLGSRSADERISQFSIENMEQVAGKSRLYTAFAGNHRTLRNIQEDINKLMQEFLKTKIETDQITGHIDLSAPLHLVSLMNPPQWIKVLHSFDASEDGVDGSWYVAGKKGQIQEVDNSLYAYWKAARDLDFLESAHTAAQAPPIAAYPPTADATADATTQIANRFSVLGLSDDTPLDNDESRPITPTSAVSDEESEVDAAPEEEWLHMMQEPETPQPGSPEDLVPSELPAVPAEVFPGPVKPTDFTDLHEFFLAFGCHEIPSIPVSDRMVSELLADDVEDMWSMSRTERESLHTYWAGEVRLNLQQTRIMEFERLRERHADALKKYSEGKEETRRQLLRNVDIIGCTTTGAAKLTTLLKGIGPQVMLVEEAGQVLEAHVLGSLVPSIQHLILIGDPLQLRPTLNNYSLSIENKRGSMLYRFDMSLMERLSSAGLPMSQINVQRRMRPSISNLIRTTLYPKLEDHDLVKQYGSVQGVAKNIFFLSHKHKENGSEDDFVSKYNTYEVEMTKDLVMYLLRQGPYSAEGDIVVLCGYLGQLARMRDALAHEVAVVIDERDQADLDDRAAEGDQEETPTSVVSVEHVQVARRVRLRTIDNYQGEEARIVILSLVRNSGGAEEDDVFGHSTIHRANIGFLRSENRTNVAISRAKEGLYILGNAQDLASRSRMWSSVIAQLEQSESVGAAFPVQCQRHPDHINYVSKPGELPRIAPDGGCLRQCDTRLKCGHLCPYKCHSDDPNHLAVGCIQRCTRLCVRGHPCTKQCADPCGRCTIRVENVELPCGHTIPFVYCYQLDDLSTVYCNVIVSRPLPSCEHEASMKCSQDLAAYVCTEVCSGILSCCGRSCKAQCHECQRMNRTATVEEQETPGPTPRLQHKTHPCEKMLYCGHLCGKACSQDHECTNICKESCRQVCNHARCRNYCSTPCAPCQEPCSWKCPHYSCPVPCGSICARLPCDKRCDKNLSCGHRCPSVCGEDCSIQICPFCANGELKSGAVVDLIMARTLGEINPEAETLDELLITLPGCRHVFTVETLDGHCDINSYYRRESADGRWLGLQSPPDGFQKPPTCPTCRAAITSPRYGRIYKRADLDILENNVASNMARSLSKIQGNIDRISKENLETRIKADIPKMPAKRVSTALKICQKNQSSLWKQTRTTPVERRAFDPANETLHYIPSEEGQLWKKIMYRLLSAYNDAAEVAGTRSAHVRAWESSFSYLYQREMDAATMNPRQAPRNPQENAMRVARMGVGQPQPRADKRFVVEAIWMTLNLRLALLGLAMVWLDELTARAHYPSENRRAWASYTAFIVRSCAEDAKIAWRIADDSESHRQKTKTSLIIMRIELEQFRFNIQMTRQNGKWEDTRQKLAGSAAAKAQGATQYMQTVAEEHRRGKHDPTGTEREWLEENFIKPARAIIDEWDNIVRSVRMDTFYQPVSLHELTEIVKSFSFGHAGHFYKCPNGHTYVIADCGGANERAHCPECGAAIGGAGHYLDSGNTRAIEFESIAMRHGAQQTPWTNPAGGLNLW